MSCLFFDGDFRAIRLDTTSFSSRLEALGLPFYHTAALQYAGALMQDASAKVERRQCRHFSIMRDS